MIRQDYKSKRSKQVAQASDWLHSIKLRWLEIIGVAFAIYLISFALDFDDDSTSISPTSEASSSTTDSQAETPPSRTEFKLQPDTTVSSSKPVSQKRLPLTLNWPQPLEVAPELPTEPHSNRSVEVTIKSGDTLSGLFSRQGFSAQDVYRVTQNKKAADYLKKLRPGKVITFVSDPEGKLIEVNYQLSKNEKLIVSKEADGFDAQIETKPIETRHAFASGVIKGSLFTAGKEAGLSDNLIMKLANIFGWDIDFVLDIRAKDTFAILYEKKYLEGEFIGNGNILAAQFVNQGEVFEAVRYTDSKGRSNYYTPKGKSMRKAFLRAPLNFMYISSNFKPRRFHPILKRWKAHRGIDYRAPTGTPVFAAGDGKVIASSYNKYNGKYIFVQHGNGIVTKYLHLSKRSVSRGKRVKQGQTIGLVGATGLAEAPHLHYEFVVNGVHRNPRTVKLPQAAPINSKEKARFDLQAAPLLNGLQLQQRIYSDVGAN
ncbi:peptidoglycan DD-metalloendopeptidase family protein [Pleionea sp. CnH1-48]|uniref:peptidoglycan DD-metalloendopeptidase family protein n=1 Tax=Pleionea sp. CnH1-48 TaxID=2954494 RepID=UPI0020968973|nr:peptidoglycan DD-metalloendopeptidase family protein [Pleionea sp. CnH1-48]MCO7227307.1 peptidoglycan DD-metalloendopeptidase family protein [Pleionea sp. CnH1-48]